MQFYVGMHQPSDAHRVARCMISVKRLRDRVSDFAPPADGWMLDSGAFTELRDHGDYRDGPEVYAAQIVRWARVGGLLAASSQDFMCEPFIFAQRLRHTGRRYTVADHQRLTIERYDAIRARVPADIHVLPVLQGYLPQQYAAHIRQYGARLTPGMWVGVGSVCKRNGSPRDIAGVLRAIKAERPDLRLHGFGCKKTALGSREVMGMLYSADSLAWSFAARKARHAGDLSRDANNWREARAWADTIDAGVAAPPPPVPMDSYWREHANAAD